VTLRALLADTSLIFHGTTVGTNAIILMQGARTGLITTRGHADVLLIVRSVGRSAGLPISQLRHSSRHQKPHPIVPRAQICEVSERVDWKGAVVLELNRDEARGAIDQLLAAGVEAIAISFPWSFINPAHELRVKQMVRERLPASFVTCAHELISRMGEYERIAAVAINCFIGAKSADYIGRIETPPGNSATDFPPDHAELGRFDARRRGHRTSALHYRFGAGRRRDGRKVPRRYARPSQRHRQRRRRHQLRCRCDSRTVCR
jgi:N-methylhydantoinase A